MGARLRKGYFFHHHVEVAWDFQQSETRDFYFDFAYSYPLNKDLSHWHLKYLPMQIWHQLQNPLNFSNQKYTFEIFSYFCNWLNQIKQVKMSKIYLGHLFYNRSNQIKMYIGIYIGNIHRKYKLEIFSYFRNFSFKFSKTNFACVNGQICDETYST